MAVDRMWRPVVRPARRLSTTSTLIFPDGILIDLRHKEIRHAKDMPSAPDPMDARNFRHWHDGACCNRGLFHARMRGA
jgi:hypothetical protein